MPHVPRFTWIKSTVLEKIEKQGENKIWNKHIHTNLSSQGQDDFFQVVSAPRLICRKLMCSMKVAAFLIYTKIGNFLKELIRDEL